MKWENQLTPKRLIMGGTIIATTVVGGCYLVNNARTPYRGVTDVKIQELVKDSGVKINTLETIVESLRDACELRILESQASTVTRLSDGRPSWIERAENIKFVGKGEYFLNFSDINKDQIRILEDEVTIWVKSPIVETSMLPTLYEYQKSNGWLNVLDLDIKPEVFGEAERQAELSLQNEFRKDNYLNHAREKAQLDIENLINTLTGEKYKVKLIFI